MKKILNMFLVTKCMSIPRNIIRMEKVIKLGKISEGSLM